MKKYFAIAALLGVFAFASVSFLAQAQQPDESGIAAEKADIDAADPSDGEAAADLAEDVDDTSGRQTLEEVFEAAHEYCTNTAQEVKGAAAQATEEEIAAAYKKCMKDKRFSDAQLKAYEADGTIK